MTNDAVKPYQVRRLAFEYEEMPGTFKERPVIVGYVDACRAVVLLAKVTGHGPRPEYPGEVRLADWKHAGLSKPSTARCSKTVEVAIEDVAVAELMGTFSPSDAELVRRGLLAAGKLEEVL